MTASLLVLLWLQPATAVTTCRSVGLDPQRTWQFDRADDVWRVTHWTGTTRTREARVSLPASANDINEAFDFKLKYWGEKILGSNGARSKVFVESLAEPVIMLEGQRLDILGPFQGDAANSSAVWVPSIKTLVASDFVFDHAHAWLSDGKTPALRQAWLDALDVLAALEPAVVVPGHAPSADYLSPASLDYTRQYIKRFIAALGASGNSAELMATMREHYPDATLPFALEYSAKILRDRWVWEGEWPPSLREMAVEY